MEGEQPYLGDLLTMVINHLLVGMILQVTSITSIHDAPPSPIVPFPAVSSIALLHLGSSGSVGEFPALQMAEQLVKVGFQGKFFSCSRHTSPLSGWNIHHLFNRKYKYINSIRSIFPPSYVSLPANDPSDIPKPDLFLGVIFITNHFNYRKWRYSRIQTVCKAYVRESPPPKQPAIRYSTSKLGTWILWWFLG